MKHLLLSLALLGTACLSLHAAERAALVIGVSDYQKFGRLDNPRQDHAEMVKALRELGFSVSDQHNPSREQIETLARNFATAHADAKEIIFYYSGHGMQVQGRNYLTGIDSSLQVETGLDELDRTSLSGEALTMAKEAHVRQLADKGLMPLDQLLGHLEKMGGRNSARVVILDCCRDNPLGTKSLVAKSVLPPKGGMGRVDAPRGMLIAFAAREGKIAEQTELGSTSLYTQALLQHIRTPGLEAEQVFKRTRSTVLEISQEAQEPAEYTNLTGSLVFNPLSLPPLAPGGMVVTPQPPTDPFAGTFAGQSWENSKGTAFRWCPPGEFWMGSSEADEKAFARDDMTTDDETQHKVKLTQGFWLSQNEVTLGEWTAIMGTKLKEQAQKMLQDDTIYTIKGKQMTIRDFKGAEHDDDPQNHIAIESPSIPIYYVSWDEAVEYCRKLTDKERAVGKIPTGWSYTLPTEAQWEYACRAGTESTLYSGDMSILGKMNAPALDSIAWYGGNSSEGYSGRGWYTKAWAEKQYPGGFAGPRRVGQKKANPWGLHDMIGNVGEWCADWYAADITSSLTDTIGPTAGVDRVMRGGSWCQDAVGCRAAFRDFDAPGYRNNGLGFRPALVPSSK